MGNLKDEWVQHGNWKRDVKLAEILGIRYDELAQTQWAVDDKTNENPALTQIMVKFDKSSPREILDKIKGLDANNTVWLDPDALQDDENESEDYHEEGEGG